MGSVLQGVQLRTLDARIDDAGRILELFSPDGHPAPAAARLRTVYPGRVDGWHRYPSPRRIICIDGMLKLVMYDGRAGSPTEGETQEVYTGIYAPVEVSVPEGVDHAFRTVGGASAMVLLGGSDDAADAGEPVGSSCIAYDWSVEFK
ncbi:MAG: hypothetical protein ACYC55_03905 [Candidatus Geothermincolia bacterium]